MNNLSRRDEIFSALSVVLLLIGTALNNAMVMMVMSAILLSLMVVFHRSKLNRGALLVALVAAVTAIVIALVIHFR